MRVELSRRSVRPLAVLLLFLLALPYAAGLLGPSGPANMVVVASAPRLSNGLTIAVGVPRTVFEDGEGNAFYVISRQGQALYPPGGVIGGVIAMAEGRGSAFVPYENFVVGNGEYEVEVSFKDKRALARTSVDKWVNYVYVFPYLRNDTVVADIVLEHTSGMPNDRIFTSGQLNVRLNYRGEDGAAEPEPRFTTTLEVSGVESFTRLTIPLDDIQRTDRNRGYYSVEATFHNDQASGNNNVPLDPALEQANPPTNYVYLELPDRCTALVPEIPGVLPCGDPLR